MHSCAGGRGASASTGDGQVGRINSRNSYKPPHPQPRPQVAHCKEGIHTNHRWWHKRTRTTPALHMLADCRRSCGRSIQSQAEGDSPAAAAVANRPRQTAGTTCAPTLRRWRRTAGASAAAAPMCWYAAGASAAVVRHSCSRGRLIRIITCCQTADETAASRCEEKSGVMMVRKHNGRHSRPHEVSRDLLVVCRQLHRPPGGCSGLGPVCRRATPSCQSNIPLLLHAHTIKLFRCPKGWTLVVD